MTEAGKLGLLRAAGGGVSPLVTKVKALAEGEGPATRRVVSQRRECRRWSAGLSHWLFNFVCIHVRWECFGGRFVVVFLLLPMLEKLLVFFLSFAHGGT